MAAVGAPAGLHDPTALISPEDWLADAERRRSAQLERIERWEREPEDSIYRRDEEQHQAFLRTLRASLRLIDHGIWLYQMGKGA